MEKCNTIVNELASSAIGGHQNVLYLVGDWGVGKSILIANVVSLVNRVLFEKPIVESLPHKKDPIKIDFSRCIGVLLETPTENPSNWIQHSISSDTFGFMITGRSSTKSLRRLALILYKMAIEKDVKSQKSEKMTAFLDPESEYPTDEIDELMVSVETIDSNTRSKMADLIKTFVESQISTGVEQKQVEIDLKKAEKIVTALEESLENKPERSMIESQFSGITVKDMVEFMKIANCSLSIAIDQLEKGYNEKNLTALLDALKDEDSVYIILIDQTDRTVSRRVKADSILDSRQI